MGIVKSWEVEGVVAAAPYERTLKVLLSPETHRVKNLAIGMVVVPPGSRSDTHSHEGHEEYWIVVDGRGKIVVADQEEELEPGTIAYATPGESHCLINTGFEPLKAYFFFAPPGPQTKTLAKQRSKT